MKKVAFFMHNFNGGGAEKVTIHLVNELAQKGYEVALIIRENKGILEKTVDNKVEIIKLNLEKENKLLKNIKNIKILKEIIESNKYDCMFSVSAPMSLISEVSNYIAKKKIKLYCIIHSTISMENRKLKKIRYLLMKIFDKYSTKTIVVSKDAREDYVKTVKVAEDKTVTIYNPVITKEFEKNLEQEVDDDWFQDNKNFKTIINVGRLTEVKNQELLLKAIQLISKEENVRLVIFGEGELRDKLEESIKEKKIENIVRLKGFVSDTAKYLKNADLFVLSSNYEGLPTALIEALAAGCKVVSTNCKTGPREILEDGKYGELVPVNDVEEMKKAIIKQLNTKANKKELIKRGMYFTTENALKVYEDLINE